MPNGRIRTFQYQRLGFVLGCLVYTTVLDLQSHMCSNRGPNVTFRGTPGPRSRILQGEWNRPMS